VRLRNVAMLLAVAVLALGAGVVGAAPLGQVTRFTGGVSGSTTIGSVGPDGNMGSSRRMRSGRSLLMGRSPSTRPG
jgi:hypothetical protein